MRFIIVDDDKFFREEVASLIRSVPGCGGAEAELHGFDDFAAVNIADDDVFFLDIADGSDENAGIQLACRIRRLSEKAHIVFVTSYTDKLRDALAGMIRPSEFLIKPLRGVEREKLFAFLRLLSASQIKKIHLKSGTKHFDVVMSDILYLHRDGRKTSVYTKNSFFQVSQSLSGIVEMLDDNFLIIDKGTAVNIKHAKAYDPAHRLIYLENGSSIYCSRDKARAYRNILNGLGVV
ncbi:MAG TPA: response regulator transcription factor [Candidatus Ornithomonoglobus intestinigallinarum]|uniref:Stage 0 sporulation protein A homolog n=1 Tax=Candidatus Ornithomonoglobus intestinigallinarum TaxID=2840894 RepID=A0A9D1KPW9_9FIRM|nr:response regulator transcription factor [Candidatus Ornithomonoglobus intestinigallinarum]